MTAAQNGQASRGEVVPVSGPAILPAEVVEAYNAMIVDVPEAGIDGMAGILASIGRATSIDELDAPWRSQGLEDWIGVPLRVTAIRKMPSDFEGGLPWFLIIDAAVTATGEMITVTTGAVSVVAQLVKAWSMGALPLNVVPRQAERPSRSGFYPQRLEIDRRPSLRQS